MSVEDVVRTPAMFAVAWFSTDEGPILGPVEAAAIEFLPTWPYFAMVWEFVVRHPGGPPVHVRDATIQIGEMVRHHRLDDTLYERDGMTFHYKMTVDSVTGGRTAIPEPTTARTPLWARAVLRLLPPPPPRDRG